MALIPSVETSHRWLVVAVRLTLLLLCSALTLVSGSTDREVTVLAALVSLAVVSTVPASNRAWQRAQPPAEALIACLLMLSLQPLPEPLLPYLLAPALAAGLNSGIRDGVLTSALAASTLAVGRSVGPHHEPVGSYLGTVSQWTLISLAVAVLGGWVHRLQAERTDTTPESAAYAAAYRLLSQLRLVSRQLSGGLDPVSLAQGLLQQLERTVPFDRGAVYVRSAGGRLAPIAFQGALRLDWDVDSPLFDDAWASSVPVRQRQPLTTGGSGTSAVIPLQIGLRTFGLVAIESDRGAFEPLQLGDASRLMEEQGLRLETALLFSEVRNVATTEERRRLAREIHDGIAQELASMGYVVDDLANQVRHLPELERGLRGLRQELTRVITELRHSIFDLRSDVQSTTGLGAALTDYVRQVGAGSKLTVHLTLDETPIRLPVESETELLRIAQEAVTNARKHANAENLWVSCTVDPPRALLCVEDDGSGLGTARTDSFGLHVMQERAARIGAQLSVRNREGGGTTVEVALGPGPTRR